MAEDNWRQLLDDPEVVGIVERVARMTRRTSDPFIEDDRVSYLWESAIHVAQMYSPDFEPEDPQRFWYGYLKAAMTAVAGHQLLNTYGGGYKGEKARERIRWHTSRQSVEQMQDELGDGAFERAWSAIGRPSEVATLVPEDAGALSVTDPDDDDGPGVVPITRFDPLRQLLLLELYLKTERTARYLLRETGVAWHEPPAGLCSDPACTARATLRGLCDRHYRQMRTRWGIEDAPTCKVGDCTRPATERGMCGTHYRAWRRRNPGPLPPIARKEAAACSIEGCSNTARARGMCKSHYWAWRQDPHRPPAPGRERRAPTPCSVVDCDQLTVAKGLCNRHYQALRRSLT